MKKYRFLKISHCFKPYSNTQAENRKLKGELEKLKILEKRSEHDTKSENGSTSSEASVKSENRKSIVQVNFKQGALIFCSTMNNFDFSQAMKVESKN